MLKVNEKRTIKLTGVTEIEMDENAGTMQIMNREAEITDRGGLTYNSYELNPDAVQQNASTVKAETAEFLIDFVVIIHVHILLCVHVEFFTLK
ncbi:hypothetical protein NE570_22315, partial [Eubacterium callanderi]|uniref:hypothetical protein n=1 Tax=Eubacterium callanderi TaxID=53442 RepID=UPI00210959FA